MSSHHEREPWHLLRQLSRYDRQCVGETDHEGKKRKRKKEKSLIGRVSRLLKLVKNMLVCTGQTEYNEIFDTDM